MAHHSRLTPLHVSCPCRQDSRQASRQRFAAVVKRRVMFFEVRQAASEPSSATAVLIAEAELQGTSSEHPPHLFSVTLLVRWVKWDAGTAKTLVWHGDTLVAGTRRGYVSLNLASGKSADICQFVADQAPIIQVCEALAPPSYCRAAEQVSKAPPSSGVPPVCKSRHCGGQTSGHH